MLQSLMNDNECPHCHVRGRARLHWQAPRFMRCKECSVIYRDPFPDAASLARLYCDSWESPSINIRETGSTDAAIANSLIASLVKTLGRRSLAGLRVMDYGAGRGAMALELKRWGADVVAVEPFGCDYLLELGVSAYRDLSDVPAALPFDGVMCLEVIEHLRDPRNAMADLYRRLRSGGWLLVTTPNAGGLPAKLTGPRWREVAKPGHIVFFTPAAIRKTLTDVGFCDVRRARWFVRYPEASLVRAAAHFGMQSLSIDGGLRMVARKP